MKRFLVALLCAALFLAPGLCEGDSDSPLPDFPFPAESEAPGEPSETPEPLSPGGWMTAELYGQTLPMLFDADPAYSYAEAGWIQATFYLEAGALYEIELIFPADVGAGDCVSTESALLAGDDFSGVTLYTTTDNGSTYAWASQYWDMEFPYGSYYSILFDSVEAAGSLARFSGTLSALLMPEIALTSGGGIELTARFSFSIDSSAAIYELGEAPGYSPL